MSDESNSELKAKSIELENAYKKLEDSERMKTLFIETLSHELRNPLTSVLGFADTTLKSYEKYIEPNLPLDNSKVNNKSNTIKENLSIIEEEGIKLLRLIDDLFSITGKVPENQEWDIQPIDIIAICQRARAAMSGYPKSTWLKIEIEAPDHVRSVRGDAGRLVKVMTNLIGNALRFTEKGKITIKIEAKENDVKVSVMDTGTGINEGHLANVFDKSKANINAIADNFSINALGLPECKDIIEHLGGVMHAKSRVNIGSCFTFTLNYFENKDTIYQNITTTKKPNSDIKLKLKSYKKQSGKPSILVVDDDPNILRLLYMELEEYNVTLVENGEEATNMLSNSEHSFDLVITDLMMKGLDGIRVLKAAKNINKDIMVIILTGYGDMKSAIDALRLDADDYVTKPYNSERFHFSINKCFEKLELKRKIKLYEKILPVCCVCSKIRDDAGKAPGTGTWSRMETYIYDKTKVAISHSYCPDCYADALKHKT